MNYIELSGPVMGTEGNITIIDTNSASVVSAAIANSSVLDETTTTTTSPEPISVVFNEMVSYLRSNSETAGYRVTVPGNRLEW